MSTLDVFIGSVGVLVTVLVGVGMILLTPRELAEVDAASEPSPVTEPEAVPEAVRSR